MTPLVEKALLRITRDINLKTGLAHPNDKNKTKEMPCRLRDAGETLNGPETEQWARSRGWQDEDARELGKLVAHMAGGRRVVIRDGPWWKDSVLEWLAHE